MKVYIAGKITGDRRYRAKFREAAKALEEAGHVVLNPATLPDGLDDVDYMRICMAMVDAADLAVFLPDYHGASIGTRAGEPAATTLGNDHQGLVATHMVKMKGTNLGGPMSEPVQTITAGGGHFGVVTTVVARAEPGAELGHWPEIGLDRSGK